MNSNDIKGRKQRQPARIWETGQFNISDMDLELASNKAHEALLLKESADRANSEFDREKPQFVTGIDWAWWMQDKYKHV